MRSESSASLFEENLPLSLLRAGDEGIVVRVLQDDRSRADRLAALGVTPGARVAVLQTFPGFVFECDQSELAVERSVAAAILVDPTIHYAEIRHPS
jgi:Fe2+ transport system protein FeoA